MDSICKKCYFANIKDNQVYCELWQQTVLNISQCNSYVPTNIKCDVCGKENAKYLAWLEDGADGFICEQCEKQIKYNIRFAPLLINEVPLARIARVYKARHDKEKIKKEYKEALNKLSQKERDIFGTLCMYKGGVLVRSLDNSEKGALGKFLLLKLGRMDTIDITAKTFKVFIPKVPEEVL